MGSSTSLSQDWWRMTTFWAVLLCLYEHNVTTTYWSHNTRVILFLHCNMIHSSCYRRGNNSSFPSNVHYFAKKVRFQSVLMPVPHSHVGRIFGGLGPTAHYKEVWITACALTEEGVGSLGNPQGPPSTHSDDVVVEALFRSYRWVEIGKGFASFPLPGSFCS